MIVSAHQPNYLPSKAFFDKMKQSHVFVLLDDVQFEKNGFTNRNRIINGKWLTVPVKHNFGQLIKDVEIDNTDDWRTYHKNQIYARYANEVNFNKMKSFIDKVYAYEWKNLIGINIAWIRELCDVLYIKTNTLFSSTLFCNTKGSDRILEICQKLGATEYASGPSGKDYLNLESFDKAGIKVTFMASQSPTSLSVLDDIMLGKV